MRETYVTPIINGEALSIHRRPLVNGKAGWGRGFFGEDTVRIKEVIVDDGRGFPETRKLAHEVCLVPGDSLFVDLGFKKH